MTQTWNLNIGCIIMHLDPEKEKLKVHPYKEMSISKTMKSM